MKHLHLILAAMLLFASPLAQAQEIVEITPPPAETTSAQEVVEIDSPTPSASAQNKPDRIIRTVPADQRDELDLQPGQTAIPNPENTESVVSETLPTFPKHTLADLYLEGGYEWTTAITICLIAMLFAAWKAPRWVKEIGLAALVLGIIYFMIGLYSISEFTGQGGMVGLSAEQCIPILFSGFRVAMIAPIYGLIVYGISLILRIVLKPRI